MSPRHAREVGTRFDDTRARGSAATPRAEAETHAPEPGAAPVAAKCSRASRGRAAPPPRGLRGPFPRSRRFFGSTRHLGLRPVRLSPAPGGFGPAPRKPTHSAWPPTKTGAVADAGSQGPMSPAPGAPGSPLAPPLAVLASRHGGGCSRQGQGPHPDHVLADPASPSPAHLRPRTEHAGRPWLPRTPDLPPRPLPAPRVWSCASGGSRAAAWDLPTQRGPPRDGGRRAAESPRAAGACRATPARSG